MPIPTQHSTHPAAGDVRVLWQALDHLSAPSYHLAALTLENNGTAPLGSQGWTLYFSLAALKPLVLLDEGTPDGDQARRDLAIQGLQLHRADAARSGDYFMLQPLETFAPILPKHSRTITLKLEGWLIHKSNAPCGFHIVFDGEPAQAVFASVAVDTHDPQQTRSSAQDAIPVQTPALRYRENSEQFLPLALQDRIVPRPFSVTEGQGTLILEDPASTLCAPASLRQEAQYLKTALEQLWAGELTFEIEDDSGDSGPIPVNTRIMLRLDPSLDIDGDGQADAEGYRLDITATGIVIIGTDPAGVFYGIQTLRQLISLKTWQTAAQGKKSARLEFPIATIADAPRFGYRGMHLDVARHFHSKEAILKLLDLLAYFKINMFHLHLADDEGWRLEIPGLPELTEYGTRRGVDPHERDMLQMGLGSGNNFAPGDHVHGKPVDEVAANAGIPPTYQGFEPAMLNFAGQGWGYYTTADFEDILTYAAERHINVIPEFDFPAHARAAIKAMEYRYRRYCDTNPEEAQKYRLVDPDDSSRHSTVQGYTDNFINPALESTYTFLEHVIAEVKARYEAVPAAQLLGIHGGGDELPDFITNVWWAESPAKQANPVTRDMDDRELYDYFFSRYYELITATGVPMLGWADMLKNGTGSLELPKFIPMPWQNPWGWGNEEEAYRLANQGYTVILCHATHLYLDFPYNKDPDEIGFCWGGFLDTKKTFAYRPFDVYSLATQDQWGNPITPNPDWETLSETGQQRIWGLQGLLWSEAQKAPLLLEYAAFPKMLGVAERAWHRLMPSKAEMSEAWNGFANALGQEILPRLDAYQPVDLRGELPATVGVNYRIPLPGAIREGSTLAANVRFPGLVIEYSFDGITWHEYQKPVVLTGKGDESLMYLRTKTPSGRHSRIAIREFS